MKFSRSEQPLAARLRAMASPIPGCCGLAGDALIAAFERLTPRSASDDAEFSF